MNTDDLFYNKILQFADRLRPRSREWEGPVVKAGSLRGTPLSPLGVQGDSSHPVEDRDRPLAAVVCKL